MKTIQKGIEQLIKINPADVFFDDLRDYPCSLGYHAWKEMVTFQIGTHVDESLENFKRLAVLAHETGHALCEAKRCECGEGILTGKKDHTLTEYHAYKYALEWLLKNKYKQALKWECDLMSRQPSDTEHGRAIKKVMKLKLWKKCQNYINQESILCKIKKRLKEYNEN